MKLDTQQEVLARVRLCTGFFCRLRGLLVADTLEDGEAIIFVCRGVSRFLATIHTIGMKFDIALFWLDADCVVIDRRLAKPGLWACVPKRAAKYIIEAAPTVLDRIAIGDKLELVEVVT